MRTRAARSRERGTIWCLKLPGGGMYCVYHGRTAPTGDVRMVFIDPMEVTEDGRLKVFGPTTSPQPVPVWTKGL